MKRILKRIAIRAAARRFAHRMPARPSMHANGINLIGFPRAVSGLGESLRVFARACRHVRIPFLVRDVNARLTASQNDPEMLPWLEAQARYQVNLMCFNPDIAYRVPFWLRRDEWQGRYNIGVWYWELPDFPPAWRYAIDLVDEIWVASEFIADAMRAGTAKPVHVLPLAVEFEPPVPDRGRWGFDGDTFVFLFSYDANSQVARKNPAAVITAFRRAFGANAARVLLVVKSINGRLAPEGQRELERLAGDERRIRFMDANLGREEMLALIGAADCYVSLHRAEGFGLGMAEAMYMGKPVIATGYSGNLAFMDGGNACLVGYRLVPVADGEYPHGAGQLWAEPDVDEAAAAMARVAGDPAWRATLGAEAARTLRERHSCAALGEAIAARLRALERP